MANTTMVSMFVCLYAHIFDNGPMKLWIAAQVWQLCNKKKSQTACGKAWFKVRQRAHTEHILISGTVNRRLCWGSTTPRDNTTQHMTRICQRRQLGFLGRSVGRIGVCRLLHSAFCCLTVGLPAVSCCAKTTPQTAAARHGHGVVVTETDTKPGNNELGRKGELAMK